MASIDKIYGTRNQFDKLFYWIFVNKSDALKYLITYKFWDNNREKRPISNFPKEIDEWLLIHCPLSFVQKAIKKQYNIK